uniref:Uncharacterized protein n=1 Tax=Manihot esculenta TaxID=3983 RepID=A0A2C9UMV8_MANES
MNLTEQNCHLILRLKCQKLTRLLMVWTLESFAMSLSVLVALWLNPQPDNLPGIFLNSAKAIVHWEPMPFLSNTRSFTGRDKYKRPLWITGALDNPSVSVQEMVMLSTSVLSIKWTIKGKPKSLVADIGGDLILKVNSRFTLNQISGQVIEHEELWDLSASSPIAQAFFWASRRLFATIETGKDLADLLKNLSRRLPTQKENLEIYPDPSGDPTKFFQRDEGFQRDAYQIALFLAVLYFVVQFLKTTL